MGQAAAPAQAQALTEAADRDIRFHDLLSKLAQRHAEQVAMFRGLLRAACSYACDLAASSECARRIDDEYVAGKESEAARTVVRSIADLGDAPKWLPKELGNRHAQLGEAGEWDQCWTILQIMREAAPAPSPLSVAVQELIGSHPLTLYENAQAAKDAGRWDEARVAFGKLSSKHPGYRDCQQRFRELDNWEDQYKQGIGAWDEGRWEDARQGLGALAQECPKYRDTSARLDALSHWGTAEEALGQDDWGQAEQAFAQVRDAQPDLLERRLPQLLRERVPPLFAAGQYQEVDLLLNRLLPFLNDQGPIRGLLAAWRAPGQLYAAASSLLERHEWDQAQVAFEQLAALRPPYPKAADQAEKLRRWKRLYGEGLGFWESQEWHAAEQALNRLVTEERDYEDSAQRVERLQRCRDLRASIQELLANVPTASSEVTCQEADALLCEVEALIPGYLPTTAYRAYIGAAQDVRRREWAEAGARLDATGDALDRVAEGVALQAAVRRLSAIRDSLLDGFLRDPSLPWDDGHPYDLLREVDAGLSPASSVKAVRDVAARFPTFRHRAAWDTLRDPPRRLLVDALLYGVHQPEPTLRALEDAVAASLRFPPAEEVARLLPGQACAVLAVVGDYAEAEPLLKAQQVAAPYNLGIAHQAAVFYLAWAERVGPRGERTAAEAAWHSAIAQWAYVLSDDAYWEEWVQARCQSYRAMPLPGYAHDLRAGLEAHLLNRVDAHAEKARERDAAGRDGPWGSLRLRWQIESSAGRLLRRIGGIPTPDGTSIACGPLLAASLGLTEPLCQHAAQLTSCPVDLQAELRGAPSAEDTRRLREYFSTLAAPAVYLEADPPDARRALDALLHADCGECPERACGDDLCTVHGSLTPTVRVCCGNCPNLRRLNPGYAQLARPMEWLREDGLRLAAEALVARAERRVIGAEEANVPAARADWQAALGISAQLDQEALEEVHRKVRASILRRAGALRRDVIDDPDTTRIDRAVELIELAGQLSRHDDTISERLGDALTARGIHKANQFDARGAVADLARAFQFTPRDHHTRDQYARALALRGMQIRNEEQDPETARQTFEKARAIVAEGQQTRPDYGDYKETLRLIDRASHDTPDGDAFAELDAVLGQPSDAPEGSSGRLWPDLERAKVAGDVPRALEVAFDLWQRSPNDREVQQQLVTIAIQRGEQILASAGAAAYDEFLADWRGRFRTNALLSKSVAFLESGPRLRHFLAECDLRYTMLADGTFSLLFDSHELGSVRVLLSVEGELTRICAPVRPREDAREGAVLAFLLQYTSETPFFRAVRIPRPPSPGLLCRVPSRYLTATLLEYLVRGASRLASVAPAILTDGPRLRDRFVAECGLLRVSLGPSEQLPASLALLDELCATRGWDVVDRAEPAWTIRGEGAEVHVEQMDVGVRLWIALGRPLGGAPPDSVFGAMADLNHELRLGKLTLTSDGAVRFACELPSLDEAGCDQTVRELGEQSSVVRGRLELAD